MLCCVPILRDHCGEPDVLSIPSDLRALPANFLRACGKNKHFQAFYDSINLIILFDLLCKKNRYYRFFAGMCFDFCLLYDKSVDN
jgi:hypothetical protein